MNYSHHYDSTLELVSDANRPLSEAWEGREHDSARGLGQHNDFMGGTLPEASKLATEGWTDAPRLEHSGLHDLLAEASQSVKLDTFASVSGAFLDVGAYCAGEPECFQEFADTEEPRAIAIAFNIGGPANISKEQKNRQGSIALALVDWLASSGFHVGVIGYHKHKGNRGHTSTVSFTLKRPEESLDMNALGYWLCHDSAQRQLMFSWQDTQKKQFIFRMRVLKNRGWSLQCKPEEIGADICIGSSFPVTDKDALWHFRRHQQEIKSLLDG